MDVDGWYVKWLFSLFAHSIASVNKNINVHTLHCSRPSHRVTAQPAMPPPTHPPASASPPPGGVRDEDEDVQMAPAAQQIEGLKIKPPPAERKTKKRLFTVGGRAEGRGGLRRVGLVLMRRDIWVRLSFYLFWLVPSCGFHVRVDIFLLAVRVRS